MEKSNSPSKQLSQKLGPIHNLIKITMKIIDIEEDVIVPSDADAQPFPAIRVSLKRNFGLICPQISTHYLLTSSLEIVDIE
ncbi:hypothetical protein Tco_1345505 [Tanacetum coccineum]